MKVYRSMLELPAEVKGSCLTIGSFDGFHEGHKVLIRKVVEEASQQGIPSLVITFSPHPVEVLRPQGKFIKLFSEAEIIEQAKGLGIDALCFQPFDSEFANLSPNNFLENWVERYIAPKAIVLGYDFGFGREKGGDARTFKEFYKGRSVSVEEVSQVYLGEVGVSSSLVRRALVKGKMYEVEKLLGEPYFLVGEVLPGQKKGRTIGFPTVNIYPHENLPLKRGVYRTRLVFEGQIYKAISNVGVRPTVEESGRLSVETHIFNFNKEIYGSKIKVEFIDFIRIERKFSSFDELKEQIAKDCEVAQQEDKEVSIGKKMD